MTLPITLKSKIQAPHAGLSVIQYLNQRYRYKDEKQWREELAAGKLTLNEKIAKGTEILAKGDSVAYTTLREEPAVNTDIKILHQDEWFLWVDKPAPLPVHADGAFVRHTLIYVLRERTGSELYLGHRLDRETSGVMILAKSRLVLGALMPLFERGEVDKRYLAITRGQPKEDSFDVEGGIKRHDNSTLTMRWKLFPLGTPDTKPSKTKFKVLKRFEKNGQPFALVECQPLTGRTNQIRVHAEAAGFPLAGDKLYGRTDQEFLDFIEFVKNGGDSRFGGRLETERHMLHAASLEFEHPITQVPIKVEAEPPQDFQDFLS